MAKNQWRPNRDAAREARIEERVVSRAREQKQSIGLLWWQYVKTAEFPLAATYLATHGTEPFCASSRVQVIGLAAEDQCVSELIAKVMDGHKSVSVPLRLLQPHGEYDEAVVPILDWLYWVSRGETLA